MSNKPKKDKVAWKCPKCGATPNKHGKGGADTCEQQHTYQDCMGFICDCDSDNGPAHGESHDDPCLNAYCYHCGWAGTFPPPPVKLKGWAKKAWDAGWRPPAGWTPDE